MATNFIGLNKLSNIIYLGNTASVDGYCVISANKQGHSPKIIFDTNWKFTNDGLTFVDFGTVNLDGYYNKNEIGNFLTDGYYNKNQTGNFLTDGYYNKNQIGSFLTDGYYNKNQVGIFLTDGYYNKNQIGIILDGYDGVPAGILDGYYNKGEIGFILDGYETGIPAGLLDGYYNKNEIGFILDGYETGIPQGLLDGYYNKNEIGLILDGYETGVPAGLLDGYYNKIEIGTILDGYTSLTINPTGSITYSFDDGYLVTGILTVEHDLNNKYVITEIYNNTDQKILPDNLELIDENSLEVDLSSFTPITGTWNITVCSALPKGDAVYSYNLGTKTTNLTSATPAIVGAAYFDPAYIVNETNKTRTVVFKTILSTTNASNSANIQLYDKDGITGGVGFITASLIDNKTDLSSAYYEVDLTTELGTVIVPGIIECLLWMGTSSGTEYVTCYMSKIDVVWS